MWEHKQSIAAGLVKAKAGLDENPLITSFPSSIATDWLYSASFIPKLLPLWCFSWKAIRKHWLITSQSAIFDAILPGIGQWIPVF